MPNEGLTLFFWDVLKLGIEKKVHRNIRVSKNINQLLKPYKLSYNSKHPKPVFYHLAAVINKAVIKHPKPVVWLIEVTRSGVQL